MPLFSKDVITFTISFVSLFVRANIEPLSAEIHFPFLPIILSPVSTKRSSLSIFSDSFLSVGFPLFISFEPELTT